MRSSEKFVHGSFCAELEKSIIVIKLISWTGGQQNMGRGMIKKGWNIDRSVTTRLDIAGKIFPPRTYSARLRRGPWVRGERTSYDESLNSNFQRFHQIELDILCPGGCEEDDETCLVEERYLALCSKLRKFIRAVQQEDPCHRMCKQCVIIPHLKSLLAQNIATNRRFTSVQWFL